MPDHYNIGDFVNIYRESFRTIDLRSALLNNGGEWRILGLALRIRIAPDNLIKDEFHNLETRFGKVYGERLRILQECFPITDLSLIMERFSRGKIVINGTSFNVKEFENILDMNGYFNAFRRGEKKNLNLDWPVLLGSAALEQDNPYYRVLQSTPEIIRDVERAGHHDSYDAIKKLLAIDYNSSSINLYVEAEVPARIDSIQATRDNKGHINLTVQIDTQKMLSSPSCVLRYYKSSPKEDYCRQPLLLKPVDTKESVQQWSGSETLIDEFGKGDRINIELVTDTIGRINSYTILAWELLKIEERNPLFLALTRFCDSETIKGMLEKPELVNVPQQLQDIPNKSRLFEVSIQWLLASLGLRSVWLHGYEKMKTDKIVHGTVDCLAYEDSKNILLLVHCSIGPPVKEEIDRQKEVQRLLRDQVFPNATIQLYSVLFSATHRQSAEISRADSGEVRIFYREDLGRLIDLIQEGREGVFVEAIVSPFFQD